MHRKRVFTAVAVTVAIGLTGMAFAQAPAQAPVQAPAAGQRAGAPQGPRVVSPEILPDKKVTFRLLAPKAGTVVLNGNWEQGTNIAMTRTTRGSGRSPWARWASSCGATRSTWTASR